MPEKPDLKLILTEDGSHSLRVPEMDETYHSNHGAIQESKHVFIKHGLLHWLQLNLNNSLSIFEVGFGTGLNAYLTTLEAETYKRDIFYKSIELHPININIVKQLNYPQKLNADEALFSKLHQVPWGKSINISAYLTIHKAQASLLDYKFENTFDLIYFDAFAPSKQPELWEYPIIEKCYHALNKNGIFVTYSAKGQLKRDLRIAGFELETLPGPPGKFEMVRAIKRPLKYNG